MENSGFISSTKFAKKYLALFLYFILIGSKYLANTCSAVSIPRRLLLLLLMQIMALHCKVKGTPLQKILFGDQTVPLAFPRHCFHYKGKESPLQGNLEGDSIDAEVFVLRVPVISIEIQYNRIICQKTSIY